MAKNSNIIQFGDKLYQELSQLIEQSKTQLVSYANSTLTTLFWQVGKRINDHILQNKRAGYGKEIVSTLSTQLKAKYGKNFEERNLRRMMQFAEQFSEVEIVTSLMTKLSWSHFVELLPIKKTEAKLFYASQSAEQGWSIREPRNKIETKTFERAEIANTQLAKSDNIPLNTFKDPYILDFLGLRDTYLEKDLESAILRELEQFILEIA